MRITKIRDGHYAKVLSPELNGLVGRLYEEIRQRKEEDAQQVANLQEQKVKTDIMANRIATVSIRYEEMDVILNRLFPADDTNAFLDRSLEAKGSVKAEVFVSTTENGAPFAVASQEIVENLNAEFIGGHSYAEFETSMNEKEVGINQRLDARLLEEREVSDENYVASEHVGSSGAEVHAPATEAKAGFMSEIDKAKLNKVTISATAPASPADRQIWFDLS